MTVHAQLPQPTWTQSENNLLPKWKKFIDWHTRTYGTDELAAARSQLASLKTDIGYYLEELTRQKREIAVLKARREAYLAADTVTDDMIMAQYERLIASPHVAGTAIGMFGELRVLIDPQVTGHEIVECGVFELAFETSGRQIVVTQMKFMDHTRDPLVYHLRYDTVYYAGHDFRRFVAPVTFDLDDSLRAYDFRTVVDGFVEYIIERHIAQFIHRKEEDRVLDWSGNNVNDPVRAMKMLLKKMRIDTAADHATKLANQIRRYEASVADYTATIRSHRKSVRELEAQIAKLEAAPTQDGPDDAALAEMLRKISTMPGVIGIRFGRDNVPVVHVRCSFVHQGKRYDLGDYELIFEAANVYGGAMRVQRTRIPAGGDYEAGWHAGAGFCFGNRTEPIRSAFLQGDFVHAVNVAIGSMNSISEGDFDYYRFAEIPLNMVWTRQVRRRPRRRKSVAQAMGAVALLATAS
jgi:cell division protein FtsB